MNCYNKQNYWEFWVDGADDEEVLDGGRGKPAGVGGLLVRELEDPGPIAREGADEKIKDSILSL